MEKTEIDTPAIFESPDYQDAMTREIPVNPYDIPSDSIAPVRSGPSKMPEAMAFVKDQSFFMGIEAFRRGIEAGRERERL